MSRFLAIAFIALAGCTTTGDGQGQVRVVSDTSALAGCQRLQQFTSISLWGGFAMTGAGYQDALASLQRQTISAGGNTLHLVSVSNTMGGTNMIGDAYRC